MKETLERVCCSSIGLRGVGESRKVVHANILILRRIARVLSFGAKIITDAGRAKAIRILLMEVGYGKDCFLGQPF